MTLIDPPPPPSPPSADRRRVRTLWIAVGVTAALVLSGGVALALRDPAPAPVTPVTPVDQAEAQTPPPVPVMAIRLEPSGEGGLDPFTDRRVTDATTFPAEVTAAAVDPAGLTPDAATGTLLISGDTASLYGGSPVGNTALYGGSNEQDVCDTDALIEFLATNPEKAAAWAGVHQLDPQKIEDYLRTLTPVVLTADTAVTNHGFSGGRAAARQSVLQAGTAVLVDPLGVPAVRCACGNPLLAPDVTDLPSAEFTGTRWATFDPSRVLSVRAAAQAQTTFTLVDVTSGAPLTLRAGALVETLAAVGEAGVALSSDGVTWHAVPGSPTGTQIAAGNGTLLVPGAVPQSRTDGTTWSPVTTAPTDAPYATFADGVWTVFALDEPIVGGSTQDFGTELRGTLHTSPDLVTWTAHPVSVPLEAPASEESTSSYLDVRSLSAGDGRTVLGVLVADWSGVDRQYLLSSTDLTTWQSTSWDAGAVVSPVAAWNGSTWGMTAFRYGEDIQLGDSHGLAGPAADDLMSSSLSATTDDVGLGTLDSSSTVGWIAAGWAGVDWQDPAFYTSADLTTWTRVGELPGYGSDVASFAAGSAGPPDLSALPALAAPVLVTGSGCPPIGNLQPIVTEGQLTCTGIVRVDADASGPQTGGNHVFPRWHHWDCSTPALPDVDAGRDPAMVCGNNGRTVEFWPLATAPGAAAAPAPAPAPSAAPAPAPAPAPAGQCISENKYGVFDYTLRSGSADISCSERIAVFAAFFARMDRGDYSPSDGNWNCFFPSGEDSEWTCSNDAASILLVPVGGTAAPAPDAQPAPDTGTTDGEISVSKPAADPPCDGTPIVIYASAFTPGRYAQDVQAMLDQYPGASWVRTEDSCSSLNPRTESGDPIYAVYRPFETEAAACAEAGAVIAAGGSPATRYLRTGTPGSSTFTCA